MLCHPERNARRDLLLPLSFRHASAARQEESAFAFIIPTRGQAESAGCPILVAHRDRVGILNRVSG